MRTGGIAYDPASPGQRSRVRWPAMAVSVIFHPLFLPVYITAFLLYLHPFLFAGYTPTARHRLLATIFVNLCLLPAVTVWLTWRLGFISGLQMPERRDRLIPLAAAMIFYFWCWFVLRNFSMVPMLFRLFLLGSFLAVIGGWMANIYFKVSLHGLAVGGMSSFMLLLTFGAEGGSGLYLAIPILISGLVGSSRLALGAHRGAEFYGGFMIGFFSQFIAGFFL